MKEPRFKSVDTLEERLKRVALLIEQGFVLCSSDEGMDDYYLACCKEVSMIVRDLEPELQTILEDMNLYPEDEVFRLPYDKYAELFEALRQKLKKAKHLAETQLAEALKGLNAKLKEMQNDIMNPMRDKRLKMLDNALNHYHTDYWEETWQQFDLNTLSNFSEKPGKLMQQMERERDKRLERLYVCEFMKSRVADYDGNAAEAYDSLLDKKGRDGLNMSQTSSYIASHRREWKGYSTLNTFFGLHLTIADLNKRIAENAKNQVAAEAEGKRKLIEETLAPLEEYLSNEKWKGHWNDLWTTLFADPVLAEILKKEELGETFNLKLVLNIVGIMIFEQVLTCNVNQANRMMFGTVRRNDYMASQHYSDYSGGKSALTATAVEHVMDILKG